MSLPVRMNRVVRTGRAWVAFGLIAIAGYWVYNARTIGVWAEGQPGAGFLPLVYGIALMGFSVLALVFENGDQAEPGGVGKPLIVIGAAALAVLGLEFIGAALSLFLLMLCLFVFVERFPVAKAFGVSAAVTLVLLLVFRVWLSVPLPRGFMGW